MPMVLQEKITGRNDYPLGMAGFGLRGEKSNELIQPLKNTKGIVFSGDLDIWGRPAIEMLLSTGKLFTYVKAIIDTGAYHTHVNNDIAKQLGSVSKNEALHRNPVYGDISLPTYMMTYSFKGREDLYFVSDVRGMDFDEDMLIGAQFLMQFCDLYIYSKEKRFELKFY